MAMIVVHRGAGMLAPGFGLLFALFMNVLTFRVFGGEYYQEHRWPKLTVLVMSGIACLVVGVLVDRLLRGRHHVQLTGRIWLTGC